MQRELKALECVSAIDIDDKELRIAAKAEDASSKAILNVISKSAVPLLSYDIDKANLETVFLNLTGRALRD